ncbi:MAG: ribonuclease III [Thermodesulfobacteriota bacterium]|nr:ribonuclease III [Thermodesulfobacteriota bacterium]
MCLIKNMFFSTIKRKRKKLLKKFEKEISCRFKKLKLLNQALTHKSYIEGRENVEHYERLEFFGDTVLDMVISEIIINKYPLANEGELTRLRAALVNTQSLAEVAKSINLGHYLLLGKGEESSNGREKESILAGTYEALIGSIYLDRGLKKTTKVIRNHFQNFLKEASKKGKFYLDYKSELIEYIQKRWNIIPVFSLVNTEGPDHDKTFQIEVIIDGKSCGKGQGKSKKEAEQNGAKDALDILKKNEFFSSNNR